MLRMLGVARSLHAGMGVARSLYGGVYTYLRSMQEWLV